MASSKTVFVNDFDNDRQPEVTIESPKPGSHIAISGCRSFSQLGTLSLSSPWFKT